MFMWGQPPPAARRAKLDFPVLTAWSTRVTTYFDYGLTAQVLKLTLVTADFNLLGLGEISTLANR